VIDPEQPPEREPPNVAAIAIIGFMAGLVIWLGGACLVLGAGGDDSGPRFAPRTVSTAPAARVTATRLPDRTNCAEIRGTDYRSDSERTWFLANCS